MHEAIKRLLDVPASEHPVLSVYLDTRPTANARRERGFQIFLRQRLRALEHAGNQSFEADRAAVTAYLEALQPQTQGVALFSCAATGLFEAFQVEEPFANQVSVGPEPLLYPLARYLDHTSTSLVVVADGERARAFTVRVGLMRQVAEVTHATDRPERPTRVARPGFGARELKYQRYLRQQDKAYQQELAEAMERIVAAEGVENIILWGSESLLKSLLQALPPALRERVVETHRAPTEVAQGELLRTCLEDLRASLDRTRRAHVEEVLADHREGGLAVAGLEETLEALYRGQVEELLLAEDCRPFGRMCAACRRPALEGDHCPDCGSALGPCEDLREQLVRRAAHTGAQLEVVTGSQQLRAHEGIAASLRWPHY